MKNNKNPLMDSFIDDILNILLDENKSSLFNEKDLVGVKTVMADSYYNNQQVLVKISNNESFRTKFGSSKLISNLIDDLIQSDNEEIDLVYLIDKLKVINQFEVKFFNNIIYGTSLKFILEFIKKIKPKYNQITGKEGSELYEELFPILYKFYKFIIEEIKINPSSQANFQQLYNEIKAAFVEQNYKNALTYFRYYYLFSNNLKNNIINFNDIINFISQYLNSSQTPDNIKKTISTFTSVKLLFENLTYRDVIFNRAKTQHDFAKEFYLDFDKQKQQELIEQWVPLNGSKDFNIFEDILENIKFKVPEPNKLAIKLLNSTGRSNLLAEKEKLYNLFFKINLSKEFDYSTYSQQIIANICSTNIDYHNLGMKQLEVNRNRIIEFDLKTNCEKALITNFLPNVTQYHQQIANLLNIGIGMKKVLNDTIRDNPNIRNTIVNYLMTAGSNTFFSVLKPNLFKTNYLLISKQFLNNAATQLRNNKGLINNYKSILIMQLSKYSKDLELEFKNLVESYNLNLNQEKDQTIVDIEDILSD